MSPAACIDLIEANIWTLQVGISVIAAMWGFALCMVVLHALRSRSPVERLLRRRFGV